MGEFYRAKHLVKSATPRPWTTPIVADTASKNINWKKNVFSIKITSQNQIDLRKLVGLTVPSQLSLLISKAKSLVEKRICTWRIEWKGDWFEGQNQWNRKIWRFWSIPVASSSAEGFYWGFSLALKKTKRRRLMLVSFSRESLFLCSGKN